MNGYADKVIMLNKDARQMDTLRKKDGTGPDMDRRADVLVFEVFDSGLIGEGALHLVHAAKEKLLTEDAAIVPMGATVHCMPINIRVDSVQGFDMQQSNRWRWRPDYEGVDLNDSRDAWEALGAPAEALSFDFYEHEANMRPGEKRVSIPVTRDGVFNAVVFWFDLQLDEENTLSTSPFGAKGRTGSRPCNSWKRLPYRRATCSTSSPSTTPTVSPSRSRTPASTVCGAALAYPSGTRPGSTSTTS